jgi:hypothetical protein
MGLQSHKSPNFGNFGTPIWESHDNIWVLAPWPWTKNIIRGKVLASPKSKSWRVLWIRVCPWLIHAPKMLQLCINQLVVWFVYVRVSNWIACHSFLVPFGNSSTPLYPRSVTNQRTCPNSFSFHCLRLWTCSWVHQGAWGCVNNIIVKIYLYKMYGDSNTSFQVAKFLEFIDVITNTSL